MKKRPLDDLDKEILKLLSHDARVSNRKIASNLGVTEGTIRGRIKRLQEDNVIRITAVTDASLMGKPTVAYVGIKVAHDRVAEVAKQIAELHYIRFVATMLGRYNILAITLIDSPDQLVDIVNDDIISIPGVQNTETSLSIKAVKYDYRWGRILDSKAALD